MPKNSPLDSSEVTAGKPKFLDVLRRSSSSLYRASPGESWIEKLLAGRTYLQFKGERSHIVEVHNMCSTPHRHLALFQLQMLLSSARNKFDN
jgi:hypothetical protein